MPLNPLPSNTMAPASPRHSCMRAAIVSSTVIAFMAAAACTGSQSGAPIAEPASQASDGPVVDTAGGALRGQHKNGIDVFRGIPYAAPPIGDQRWKSPMAPEAWSETREATAFGPSCVQPPLPPQSVYNAPPEHSSEDCLSLNVWAPEDASDAPVIVWIHGGSLRIGGTEFATYDGTHFAERGIVFVSINYRLGVLGWLAHPDLSTESPEGVSGNYGLQDQIAALEWVEDNISGFGGDPDNVTIMGESAGALSVAYLLTSPPAEGLFDKAIMESVGSRSFSALNESVYGQPSAEETGRQMLTKLGFETIEAARQADPQNLINRSTLQNYTAEGTIDGVYLPEQLIEAFDDGAHRKVPLIAGFNSGEGRTYAALLPKLPETAEAYEAKLAETYPDRWQEIVEVYPSDDIRESALAMLRDNVFGWAGERFTRKMSGTGQPAYYYVFDHCYPSARERDLCAFHGSEVPYVFGTLTADELPAAWPAPDAPEDRALSNTLLDYWASFAATGEPTSGTGPAWLPYGVEENYLHIEAEPKAATDPYPGMFELHEALVQDLRDEGKAWFLNIEVPSQSED